jgi:phosphoribosyl-dephospho-CoA transferase
MPKLAEMSDEDLRRVIDSDVHHMQQADLSNEQRKLVERRYAICISEAIGRARLRMREED